MDLLTRYEIATLAVAVILAIVDYQMSETGTKKRNALYTFVLGLVLTVVVGIRFGALPHLEAHLALAESIGKNPQYASIATKLSKVDLRDDNVGHRLMKYILNIRMNSLDSQVSAIAQGRFVVQESEMPGFALEMIGSVGQSVSATSYVQFKDWWNTPWGMKYEELNAEAARRGVKIKRIFIFSSRTEFDFAKAHMLKQLEYGVDVRFVFTDQLNTTVTDDMIVIDDKLAGALRLTPEKGIKEAEFFTNQSDIDGIRRRITDVELQSARFSPQSSPKP